MVRKNPTKKRLDELFEVMKTVRAEQAIHGKQLASKEDVLLLAFALAAPVNTAFEKAGLDIEDLGDWVKLLIYFCVAVYGKTAGQPTTWSQISYERLLKDIAEIKTAHPDDDELECCNRLLRNNKGTYNKVRKAPTLRRVLQSAKQWEKIREAISRLVTKGKGAHHILKAGRQLMRQSGDAPRSTL